MQRVMQLTPACMADDNPCTTLGYQPSLKPSATYMQTVTSLHVTVREVREKGGQEHWMSYYDVFFLALSDAQTKLPSSMYEQNYRV